MPWNRKLKRRMEWSKTQNEYMVCCFGGFLTPARCIRFARNLNRKIIVTPRLSLNVNSHVYLPRNQSSYSKTCFYGTQGQISYCDLWIKRWSVKHTMSLAIPRRRIDWVDRPNLASSDHFAKGSCILDKSTRKPASSLR
jgi:hypothetical protein